MSKCSYEFNEIISATLINPFLSLDEFNINCNLIKKYNIRNISTSLNYLSDLRNYFENYRVNISVLISYPLSDCPDFLIDQIIDYAIEKGANGIDYLPKFFYLSKNEDEKFANNIEIISKKKLPLNLIFNKYRMQKETFNKAINISLELGVKFFQFGDGFGTTLNIFDLKKIQELFDENRKIKVVGNIRDIESVIELLNNGADNIGTTSFHEIFKSIE
tara:strand:- start:1491 stop:2144 length:654 start_codon:yes stop_codon:yes gene_type:complete